MAFHPDYRNLEDAAYNREARRLPLYEHLVNVESMENIQKVSFASCYDRDKQAFFREYCRFFRDMGYDTVSFEGCITEILPGGGALGGHKKGAIQSREDFEAYPWDSLVDRYFERFTDDFNALRYCLPEGMKGVGGVGNGVFECVQDLTGYMDLCFMRSDDPDLYEELFGQIGAVMKAIWSRFLSEFGDLYCVCRFGG